MLRCCKKLIMATTLQHSQWVNIHLNCKLAKMSHCNHNATLTKGQFAAKLHTCHKVTLQPYCNIDKGSNMQVNCNLVKRSHCNHIATLAKGQYAIKLQSCDKVALQPYCNHSTWLIGKPIATLMRGLLSTDLQCSVTELLGEAVSLIIDYIKIN